jgi:hypothetical protein
MEQHTFMQRSDFLAFLGSLGITGLLIWGLIYFINTWWDRLPKVAALTICILLAVMMIGYPIYALARWSDRYLARVKEEQQKQSRQDTP